MDPVTPATLDSITRHAVDAHTRELAATGATLTHDQAAEVGEEALDWLRTRLDVVVEVTPDGVELRGMSERLHPEHLTDGWSVRDDAGGRWWPGEEAAAEIEAATDPAAEAIRICTETPMRGEWHA